MNRTTGRRARAVFSLLVLALAVGTAASAVAVDVRGTLRVPSGFGGAAPALSEEEARRLFYWNEWNGFIEPRERGFDAARDLSVVLRGEGDMAGEQPGFRIANGGLWPTTLVERAGATLRVENTDPCAHQLFAEGHPELNPTPTSPGLTRTAVLATEGDWPLRDQLYSHVQGHLHVIPDLVARAELRPDGTFHFRNVTPGTYTLEVYRGAAVIHTQAGLEVTDHELTIEPIALAAAAAE